jgi:integrase/recombinase XerC
VRELTLEGLAPASIRRKLTVVGRFLRFSHERGMRTSPAPELPRLPSTQKSAPRWLPVEARTACLRAAGRVGSEENQALVTFLLHTGLRASEVCGLSFGDIDAGRYEGALRVRGKGSKERMVPLNAAARAALKDLGWTKGATPERPLLASQRGERLTPSGLLRRIRTVGQAAGLRVTPHTLRHTYLKSLIDAGAPLQVAAALAGHASLQTTAGYTTPGEEDLRQAAQKLPQWDK